MDALSLLEKTVTRLRNHEGQYAEISRQSGVSYSSLVKLAQGHAGNPTIESLQRVIDALDAFEGVVKPVAAAPASEPDPDESRIEPLEWTP